MTLAKIWFLSCNNANPIDLVLDILSTEGFTYSAIASSTTGFRLDIKQGGGDLSTTVMSAVKSVAQDLGIYLKYI